MHCFVPLVYDSLILLLILRVAAFKADLAAFLRHALENRLLPGQLYFERSFVGLKYVVDLLFGWHDGIGELTRCSPAHRVRREGFGIVWCAGEIG